MSNFIKSLKRLYASGKIQKEKLLELYENKKITMEDYEYITS